MFLLFLSNFQLKKITLRSITLKLLFNKAKIKCLTHLSTFLFRKEFYAQLNKTKIN